VGWAPSRTPSGPGSARSGTRTTRSTTTARAGRGCAGRCPVQRCAPGATRRRPHSVCARVRPPRSARSRHFDLFVFGLGCSNLASVTVVDRIAHERAGLGILAEERDGHASPLCDGSTRSASAGAACRWREHRRRMVRPPQAEAPTRRGHRRRRTGCPSAPSRTASRAAPSSHKCECPPVPEPGS
jgi:hypothetical protein